MKTIKFAVLLSAALLCSGCRFMENEDDAGAVAVDVKSDASTVTTFGNGPEQVWIEKAKFHFRKGEYGLAERYYRQALEERSKNVEAWIGLAATYDNLKRFDEADKAYEVVVKMAGNTPSILNNLGYHYMLKGDFASAERALMTAHNQDPNNALVNANLALLQKWRAKATRS